MQEMQSEVSELITAIQKFQYCQKIASETSKLYNKIASGDKQAVLQIESKLYKRSKSKQAVQLIQKQASCTTDQSKLYITYKVITK
jgi:hypothetical protein